MEYVPWMSEVWFLLSTLCISVILLWRSSLALGMIKKNLRSFSFYSEAYLHAQGDASWWKSRLDSRKLGMKGILWADWAVLSTMLVKLLRSSGVRFSGLLTGYMLSLKWLSKVVKIYPLCPLFLPAPLLSKVGAQWFCPERTDGAVLPPCAVMGD